MADFDPPATQEEDRGRHDLPQDPQSDGQSDPPSVKAAPDNKAKSKRPGNARDEDLRPAPAIRTGGPAPNLGQSRQAYAAIDLGTNNCRLLIARPSGENFVVIDAFSRVVRLGEGLAQTGRLSDEAMDRAVAALKVCADKLRRRNVHLARSVATEACRRASNGEAFIERVRTETGIALDVISAQEEARLAVLGCHVLLEQGEGPAMIFDIGGGSTELVLIETGEGAVPRILDWQSVPWGVVSLTESFADGAGSLDRVQRLDRYRRMRRAVRDSFADFSERLDPFRDMPARDPPRLLGTSGTVTTLASLHLGLPQYDRRAVDGLIVPATAMRDIARDLSSLDRAGRQELPCIGRDRAELVVAGCAILETILDLWPAEKLGVADRGIREGILRSLMAGARLGDANRALARRERAL
ncbi:Ppx/GppA phosphatase family protein [Croceicoccus naphthovorans]|uniref:Exopolyphosphatase n=1 Tax=Croceicoccus naphthovorans TaxID=1348774 RepID=A0A0G3XL87_9SPHN|nr:Ppx/GppA phosphatase family protein [Croceicoccus naphthovorans]AKM11158.1 exopolyphosphatase [Croceicoccus naphthovorans]MBB3989959.1 exopolyphosphatase/guanosine-5'-triphosphate,3'-diphosphate pyrophosphatase [Croceicoccus naphthovorans]